MKADFEKAREAGIAHLEQRNFQAALQSFVMALTLEPGGDIHALAAIAK